MRAGLYPSLCFVLILGIFFACDNEQTEYIEPSPEVEQAINIGPKSFTAQWKPFPSVDFYLIDVALDANFETRLNDEFPMQVEGTTFEITNLNPSTTYYYRVGAQTQAGTVLNFSEAQQISTAALPSPLALEPTDIGLNYIVAAWSPVETADGYLLEVSTQIDFQNIAQSHQFDSNQDTVFTISELEERVGYFYRVKSRSGEFLSEPSNTKYAITTELGKPTIGGTTEISYNTMSLYWSAIIGADAYEIEVSKDPLFEDIGRLATIEDGITATQLRVESLEGNTLYFVRLRAKKELAYSGYSDTYQVKTKGLEVPQMLAPSQLAANQFTAHWSAVADAENYALDLATDMDFNSILSGYNSFHVNGLNYTFTELKPDTQYYLRVRAVGFNSFSDFSEIQLISTQPLNAPANLSISTQTLHSFTLSWSEAVGAESYVLSIAEDIDFSQLLPGYAEKEIIGNSWKVEGIAPEKNYYIKLSSKYGNVLSEVASEIMVEASLSSACVLSRKIWEDGWVETYTYNAGQLISISGDSANIARYNWELVYQNGQLTQANKFEGETPDLLTLQEVWLFGYQNGRWTSLHRQDDNTNTLEYSTLAYDTQGRLIQMSSYTDQTMGSLNTQENYSYQNGHIAEARNDANELIKSWKYSDDYNPDAQFMPQLYALMRDPAAFSVLGYVPAATISFYQHRVGSEWVNQAFIYETNGAGMPVSLYSGNNVSPQTYEFQSCGF